MSIEKPKSNGDNGKHHERLDLSIEIEVMKLFNLKSEEEKEEWALRYGKAFREIFDEYKDFIEDMHQYEANRKDLYEIIKMILERKVEEK